MREHLDEANKAPRIEFPWWIAVTMLIALMGAGVLMIILLRKS